MESASSGKSKLYPYSILRTANTRRRKRKKKRVRWAEDLPVWRGESPGRGNPLFPKDAPPGSENARDGVKFALPLSGSGAATSSAVACSSGGGGDSSSTIPRIDLASVNELTGHKGLRSPRSAGALASPRHIHETYPVKERDSIQPALIISSRAHGATLSYKGVARPSDAVKGRFSPRSVKGRFSLSHGKQQGQMALLLSHGLIPAALSRGSVSMSSSDASSLSRQEIVRTQVKRREEGMSSTELEDKIRYPDLINAEGESMLLSTIPLHHLSQKKNQLMLATFSGPYFDESMRMYRNGLAARSMSTYPTIPGMGRAGDPICDFYYVRVFEESTVLAMADGCNWGEAPKVAAQAAAQSFVRYLQDRLHVLTNTNLASHYILRGIAAAHQSIVAPYKDGDVFRAGTATLLGGVLMPLRGKQLKKSEAHTPVGTDAEEEVEYARDEYDTEVEGSFTIPSAMAMSDPKERELGDDHDDSAADDAGSSAEMAGTASSSGGQKAANGRRASNGGRPKRRRWGFVFGSVGDCKVFLFHREQGICMDLTESNRAGVANAKDCGGRLGPYLDGGHADLRNLALYYSACNEGDAILVLSDGAHDNFDPELLGKKPRDLGIDKDSWDEMAFEEAERHKCVFRERFLMQLIAPPGTDHRKVTVAEINERVMNHCITLTQPSRDFMEQHPELELPEDYKRYPGKMDHTTCVCIAIDSWDASSSQCFVAPRTVPVGPAASAPVIARADKKGSSGSESEGGKKSKKKASKKKKKRRSSTGH